MTEWFNVNWDALAKTIDEIVANLRAWFDEFTDEEFDEALANANITGQDAENARQLRRDFLDGHHG